MTQCIENFQRFVRTKRKQTESASFIKRKEMLNQLVKINLILLFILLLNGISNSYQQKSTRPITEDTLQALAKLQAKMPSAKLFKQSL
ncbi:MAG: hypothetical protein ACJAT2_002635 [Bacteriovoracaceae bacterium]|jgi:hypothetical protein